MHRPITRLLLALGSALALTAAILPFSAAATQGDLPDSIGSAATNPEGSTYDVRRAAAAVLATDAQRDAMSKLVAGAAAGTRATWDSRFGTPKSISSRSGYLSAARAGDTADVARSWIDGNRALFGMSAAEVAALRVTRNHTLPGTGTAVVTFQQVFGGVASAREGRLAVAVTRDGNVLSYNGNPTRGSDLFGSYSLTAAEALKSVAGVLANRADFTPEAISERAGFTEFAKGPFAASSYVQKAVFPVADGARAAYRVIFVEQLDEAYETFVDAGTGRILFRESLVQHEAEGTVYENFPGATKGGTAVKKSFGPNQQSPRGWVDPSGAAGVNGPTTFGNNANTYANYSNFLAPADQAPRPVNPTAQFNYSYGMNWQQQKGATVPPSYALDLDPAATNLFYHHNRIHDEFYSLGFTETGGNFQVNNNGNGGAGGDPLLGLVHAGAASGGAPTYTGRDNAYMLTLPDGIPSWSGMFLWEPINDAFEGPYSDGNFDASVVEHEYGHGLSTRYVAGGAALGTYQSDSMGEGWSDWYALNYLYRENLQDKAVVGEYATGNATRGIRNWDYDENPTVYGDLGYDLAGPEVHSDGEIWTAMLWDLRKALVSKYGAAQGGEVAQRLVTDAMPLTAADPSFLDGRDGILVADKNRYQDANRDLIWSVFARRGAGKSAKTPGGDHTNAIPAYDHEVAAKNSTLVGKVVNATTDAPVKDAKVFLGVFEARTTPVARSSETGHFAVPAVAGTYPVTIQAPGFGSQTFDNVSIAAGSTKSLAFSIAPNLASLASGATLVSTTSQDDGLPGKFMLDDTEATVWSTQRGATPYNGSANGRITVKLPKAQNVSSIQVSAFKNTTSSRFSALKDFTFEVSNDGETWKTVQTGGFTYQTPRPVAPDLHYKTFSLAKPVKAQYVRFSIDSIQGETVRYAQAAELQVFGKAKSITPVAPPADLDFSDTGTIVASNPTAGDPTGLQMVYGVTGNEMTNRCVMPPASQGADAWVTKLPAGFGDGTHTVEVVGGPSSAAVHDIDLFFLNSSCDLVGEKATSSPNESTVIPGSTVYVLSHLWAGANVPITLTAKDAG